MDGLRRKLLSFVFGDSYNLGTGCFCAEEGEKKGDWLLMMEVEF